MKKLFLFIAVITLFGKDSMSQNNELKTQDSSLIYSQRTILKLKKISDSLNLKFKVCEFNPTYKSIYQSKAHLIHLETNNIKAAKKDLENNMSYSEFKLKYPTAKLEEELLVIKTMHDYKEKSIEFYEVNLGKEYGEEIHMKGGQKEFNLLRKGTWIFDYSEKTSYSEESLTAFYFIEEFKSTQIPDEYAKMIAYSECLIDTTESKIRTEAKPGRIELPENYQELSMEAKTKLLEEMRNTEVVGYCSMDNSPVEHAINIAKLSAETVNWEVFLKAHLDILNDRFARMSDASYAWNQRNTYIKELEMLDIDVQNLILGICFRIDTDVKFHYFGNIGRVGRALAESQDRRSIFQTMIKILKNDSLDDYNRVMCYFLIDNFNYYIKDENEKKNNQEAFKETTQHLPSYLRKQIK